MVTREQVEDLKRQWKEEPIWDLADTEGFESYKEELQAFQKEQEAIWEEEEAVREQEIDHKAQHLGVEGLYRLLLKHEKLLNRQERAIQHLINNQPQQAYRTLLGVED